MSLHPLTEQKREGRSVLPVSDELGCAISGSGDMVRCLLAGGGSTASCATVGAGLTKVGGKVRAPASSLLELLVGNRRGSIVPVQW